MNRRFQLDRVVLFGTLLVMSLSLSGWHGVSQASRILTPIGGIDSEVLVQWNSNNDADKTGIRVKNLSTLGGNVEIELIPGVNPLNLQLPDGFLLLDNTLQVTSGLIPGGRRIRARMDFGRYGGRAGIRARGIRADSIRLLRADLNGRRWIRAVDSIRKRADADIRFLTAIRADFVLGHHGIDKQNQFVWAVLDTSGDQFFAIGGLAAAVPLPAAWLLFLSGSGLLLLVRRRRQLETS